MTETDYAVIAVTKDGRVRVMAARTTVLAEEARRRHNASPTAAAAIGRALTGAALLGVTLKDPGTITLRLLGDGPIGGVVAQAGQNGDVRGYARNPRADLPPTPAGKLDVGGLIGRDGFCYVTRDMGLKEPYTGTSPLASGEIGEDLTRYLYESEQTPSAVSLGVLVSPPGVVTASGGLFVQLLPGDADEDWGLATEHSGAEPARAGVSGLSAGAEPDDGPRSGATQAGSRGSAPPTGPGPAPATTPEPDIAARLEASLAGFKSVSRLIEQGLSPEDLVDRALGDMPHRILEKRPLRFFCRCIRERALDLLASLKPADLAEIIAGGQGAELDCQFCHETYRFSADDLAGLARP